MFQISGGWGRSLFHTIRQGPQVCWLFNCLKKCIYVFLAMLGLRYCLGFSLVVAIRGYSLVGVLRLVIAVASFVVEQGLWGAQAQ